MSEEQYNELLKAYTKEALASMIKADICSRFPEPYASMYCQQFDDFKNVANFFEFAAKLYQEYLLLPARGKNFYIRMYEMLPFNVYWFILNSLKKWLK